MTQGHVADHPPRLALLAVLADEDVRADMRQEAHVARGVLGRLRQRAIGRRAELADLVEAILREIFESNVELWTASV